ncbi:MAG: ChbG/HpnK family deacetylase [Verrucomicrobiia bacterium]
MARGLFFWALCIGLDHKIRRAGLRAPDAIHGLLQSGHVDEMYLTRLLPQVGDGVTEIYFHPGADDDPILHRWQPDYSHAAETAALLSPRLKQLLHQHGIQLIGFEDAIPSSGRMSDTLASEAPQVI